MYTNIHVYTYTHTHVYVHTYTCPSTRQYRHGPEVEEEPEPEWMEFGPTDRFDIIELKGFDKEELEKEGILVESLCILRSKIVGSIHSKIVGGYIRCSTLLICIGWPNP